MTGGKPVPTPLPPGSTRLRPGHRAAAAAPAVAHPGEASAAAPLSLKSFLPYRLNILAQTVSAGFAVAYSQAFGISAPEWRLLSTLGEFRRMTAKEIGDHSRMHKATVSRAVLSLDRRRLLVRKPSAADRREEILSLTADGRGLYEAIAPMALRYEQGLLQGLSADDIARLDRLIRHLMGRAVVPWFEAEDGDPADAEPGR